MSVRSLGTAESIAIGCVYLALVMLMEAAGWGFGLYRGIVLFVILLHVIFVAAGSEWPDSWPAEWLRSDLPRYAIWAVLVPVAVSIFSVGSVHRVRVTDGMVVAAAICILWYQIAAARGGPRPMGMGIAGVLLMALCLLIPVTHFVSGLIVPKLLDIATTTAIAAKEILAGRNPYQLNLDSLAATMMHDTKFGGYKYLPLMSLAYLPFVLIFGAIGILVGNAVFYTAIAFVIQRLSRRISSRVGFLPVILFLATPIVASDSLGQGSTDLASELPILIAFLRWERDRWLVGFLIGVSLAMKPVPAIFAVALCLPMQRREWSIYALGVIIGCVPAVVYFAWSPQHFYDNIILFNLVRPADSSTWQFYAPPWAALVAKIVGVIVWATLSLWCVITRGALVARLLAYVIIVLSILLAAPTIHDNYATWWIPALVVLCGTFKLAARAGAPGR